MSNERLPPEAHTTTVCEDSRMQTPGLVVVVVVEVVVVVVVVINVIIEQEEKNRNNLHSSS